MLTKNKQITRNRASDTYHLIDYESTEVGSIEKYTFNFKHNVTRRPIKGPFLLLLLLFFFAILKST